MDDRRIVAARPSTLTHRFSADDAAGVSVTVTDLATGLGLVAGAPVQDLADARVWTATLAAAQIPTPTVLEVAWDAGGAGWVETDYAEVAGGRYADVDVIAAATGYDPDDVDKTLTRVERSIEQHCLTSFVPTYRVETLVPRSRDEDLVLSRDRVTSLRLLIVGGIAVDPIDAEVTPSGVVTRTAGWTPGSPVDIGYVSGFPTAPADLADAAADVTRQLLRDAVNPHSGGGSRKEFAEGASWVIATASPKHGRLFGIPTIDAVIENYREHAVAVG